MLLVEFLSIPKPASSTHAIHSVPIILNCNKTLDIPKSDNFCLIDIRILHLT